VSGDITRDHYARLAPTYDENWTYNSEFIQWMSARIQERLRVDASDLVADIGCGTGLFAREIARHARSVVCIDPSAQMLSEIPSQDKLIPLTGNAEDVAGGRAVLPFESFDALLLKEVIHHVEDPAVVLNGLVRLLRPGGRILIVMLPSRISYPLFADALELFTTLQPDPADIADQLRGTGLQTDLSYDAFPLSFATERYLQMVRSRYMSLLSHFEDDQLESGIAEIRASHPGERITFTDTFAFILGTAA